MATVDRCGGDVAINVEFFGNELSSDINNLGCIEFVQMTGLDIISKSSHIQYACF